MRVFRLFIIGVVLLGSTFSLQAQNKKSKFRRSVPTYTIEEAKEIMKENPKEAIRMLNIIITSNNEKKNISIVSSAYELLGDINTNNNLVYQAVERYLKALDYAIVKDGKNNRPRLYYKMGNLLVLNDPRKAKEYFKECMEYGKEETYYYRCFEGAADCYTKMDSFNLSSKIYHEIEQEYIDINHKSLSRIQSKIADIFAEQNDISNALYNFNKAKSNYKNQNTKDDKVLQNTTNSIILKQQDLRQEIDLRNSNISLYKDRPELVADELIQLAEAYVKLGENKRARLEINALIPRLNILPESIKSDFYKQSSEMFYLEGDYKLALADYKKYEESRTILLDRKESELNERIGINELQKTIDISEKEYIIERDRIVFQENLVHRQKWIIYLLSILLLGTAIASWLIYRSVRSKNMANKILELRSLRAEMNPHFIFNALGSVNEYIANHDSRRANRFLSNFSKLMRSAMEMNKKDLVPLREELVFAEMYLKLEHARWEDKFDFDVDLQLDERLDDIMVPPLILQPYIENAIWHGLRYKKSKGLLRFIVIVEGDNVVIEVTDDGIGRLQSQSLKTVNQQKYSSTGLRNTKRRTELINEIYGKSYTVSIEDLDASILETGTKVIVKMG